MKILMQTVIVIFKSDDNNPLINSNRDIDVVIKIGKIFKIFKSYNFNDNINDQLSTPFFRKQKKSEESNSRKCQSLIINEKNDIIIDNDKKNKSLKSDKKLRPNIDFNKEEKKEKEENSIKLRDSNNESQNIEEVNEEIKSQDIDARRNKSFLSFAKILPSPGMCPSSLQFDNKKMERMQIPCLSSIMNSNFPRIELPKLPNPSTSLPSSNINFLNFFLSPSSLSNHFSPISFVLNPNISS